MNLPTKAEREKIRQQAEGQKAETVIAAEAAKRKKEEDDLFQMRPMAKKRFYDIRHTLPDLITKAIAAGKVELDIILPEKPANYTMAATDLDREVARLLMDYYKNEEGYRLMFKSVDVSYDYYGITADGGQSDPQHVYRQLPAVVIFWGEL